jgi:uncharacterized membrane protein YagU involved in acid resistance
MAQAVSGSRDFSAELLKLVASFLADRLHRFAAPAQEVVAPQTPEPSENAPLEAIGQGIGQLYRSAVNLPFISRETVAGGLAGLIATAPMTLVMLGLNRVLPGQKNQVLPPEDITQEATAKTNIRHTLTEDQHKGLTLFNHFAYGAAVGTLFFPVTRLLSGLSAGTRGAAFGLFVWAASYFGLMPALKLHPPANQEPPRMNGILIGSHIVWGVLTGILAVKFSREIGRALSR